MFRSSRAFAFEHLMRCHLQIEIQGIVQGVGFRPFVARLASCFFQTGWVKNTSTGVSISIEGLKDQQQKFLDALQTELPPFAEILDANFYYSCSMFHVFPRTGSRCAGHV